VPTGNLPALLISALALLVAIYGVVERRNDARRMERLRLASLIAELNGLHLEQAKSPDGFERGDFTDVINSRQELLSMQALALLPRFQKEATSSELRVLAHALKGAGYHADVDRVWGISIAAAMREGATQTLFAHRGYAYFLFSVGRAQEGRTEMRRAIEAVGQDDYSLVRKIETLKYWSIEELAASTGSQPADELRAEAGCLAQQIESPRIRRIEIEELLRIRSGPSSTSSAVLNTPTTGVEPPSAAPPG
jgi:hypothetical protein